MEALSTGSHDELTTEQKVKKIKTWWWLSATKSDDRAFELVQHKVLQLYPTSTPPGYNSNDFFESLLNDKAKTEELWRTFLHAQLLA